MQLPYVLNLSSGKETIFKIQSDYAEEIALIDGKDWFYFKKDNNNFTILHKPKNQKLQISVKINPFDSNFNTILQYNIIN